MLGTAGLHQLGLDHLSGARLLGLVGLVVAVLIACVDPGTWWPEPRRALTGGLLLALSGSLAAWSMGGLEHTFLAGLVGLAMVCLVRFTESGKTGVAAAWVLALVVLTRVDGVVLVAGMVVGLLFATRRITAVLLLALPAIGAVIAQEVFRVVVYDAWVPHTATVKVSGTSDRAWIGVRWMWDALQAHAVMTIPAALAWLVPVSSARIAIPAATAVVWCAVVAAVGGDIFPAWRQLVPALPAFALLANEVAVALSPAVWRSCVPLAVVVHVALANIVVGRWDLWRRPNYEWRVPPVGTALRSAWGPADPLLAVDAAGVLPYATGFRSLDMLGLNDRWIATHPPPGAGGAGIGHDLGDPSYVWRRRPDLFAFNSGLGGTRPRWYAGRKILAREDFHQTYQLVLLGPGADPPEGTVGWFFVRREDGPLGVTRRENSVRIPGWFFATELANAAYLVEGALRTPVTSEHPARLPALPLPGGTWHILSDPPGLDVRVGCAGQTSAADAVVRTAGSPIDLTVHGDVFVREVRLVRGAGPATFACPAEP